MDETTKPILPNSVYDKLKFCALILFPALGTLYFTLSGLLNLPAADEVVGTVVAVDTFLGAVLGFSTKQYNESDEKYDGQILVGEGEDDVRPARMVIDDPTTVADKQELRLKVRPQ